MDDARDDPYDREAVLARLAFHGWNHRTPDKELKHRQSFIDKGIASEAELKKAIADGIERKDTLAFSARPDPQKKQTLSREIYEISMKGPNPEPYKIIAIVNPGLNKRGELSGGTCYIPDDAKQFRIELQREKDRSHNRAEKWEPQLVVGGRPALRECERQKAQEQRRERPKRPRLNVRSLNGGRELGD